jgi:uncharacterized MAPEG superfamily protein
MAYVALVTLVILIQYIFFMLQAGRARAKGDVVAPATSGSEIYERTSRVQINTLEQLIITLPAIMICAHYFRPDVAAILGWVFIIGRFVYSYSYTKDPKSRGLGFVIGFLANAILIGCGLYGIIAGMI